MIYVISDIHGYPFEKVMKLFNDAGFSSRDFMFVLGDVIDRGKDGIKLLRWISEQPNIQFINGNHELMMLSCRFLLDIIDEGSLKDLDETKIDCFSHWMSNGASPTIRGLEELKGEERELPFEFVSEAPLYDAVSIGNRDFILTHSGLGNFKAYKELEEYTVDELVWNRPSADERYFDGITTVFGHTPTVNYSEDYKGKIMVTDTWINIDTGAGWGFPLTLLRLDDMKTFSI